MSIIQEALRKAGNAEQKPEVRREEKPEPPKEMPKPEIAKKSVESKYVYYAMTGFLLILLIGIIMAVSRSSQSADSPVSLKRPEPVIMPKIERREEQPARARRKDGIGGFVLNGIMYLVDGPRAIINDIIVGEGEMVSGAKVEKIKKDGVLLNYKNSEVVLNINRSN